MDLFVADELVVPVVFGNPFLTSYCPSIRPKAKLVTFEVPAGDSTRAIEVEYSCPDSRVVRSAEKITIPPFSEAYIRLRTDPSNGFATIRPACPAKAAQQGRPVMVRNGLVCIGGRGHRGVFYAIIGNFSSEPCHLTKGRIVGVADVHESLPNRPGSFQGRQGQLARGCTIANHPSSA
jgi:hypothetical protein